MEDLKECAHCGIEKPLAEFHRRADTPDGLQYRCKDCHALPAGEGEETIADVLAVAAHMRANSADYLRRHRESMARWSAAVREQDARRA